MSIERLPNGKAFLDVTDFVRVQQEYEDAESLFKTATSSYQTARDVFRAGGDKQSFDEARDRWSVASEAITNVRVAYSEAIDSILTELRVVPGGK